MTNEELRRKLHNLSERIFLGEAVSTVDFRTVDDARIALSEAEARVKELEAGIEWEYRCLKAAEWTGGTSVILPGAHYHADCPRHGFRTERRTPAGPWVPVESEGGA